MYQCLKKGYGGELETYFYGGRPASATLNLFDAAGAQKVTAGSVTLDLVSTTCNGAVAAKAATITLTAVTNIVAGRRYQLGSVGAAEPWEVVEVKSVSGMVATLYAPTRFAHATLATFAGIRGTYAVSASQAAAVWFDGVADWVPASGEIISETVDCMQRPIPTLLIGLDYLRQEFPKEAKLLDAELNLQMAVREARDQLLLHLGGKARAHTMRGTDHLRYPCALQFWLTRMLGWGDEWLERRKVLKDELDELIERLQGQVPVDADQDGNLTSREDGPRTGIPIFRA
jgi:hypothetical protein